MIACPWCHYSHPSQLTAKHCAQCQQSFETLYLCTDRHCQMHTTFQPASRECTSCGRRLTGEFSGRDITWGNAIYRIREYLGGGGMGEVYRGVEQDQAATFSRECAVKFNKNMMDADIVERFKREVQVLNLLQNPHNIRVFNYGELYEERHTGLEVRAQFMVMELLKGDPLNELIEHGGMAPNDAVSLFVQICGALSEAHQKGIVHRDIKPHNIMLQDVSGSRFAKVFDFGLARQTNSMDARLSTSGVVMGTFRYMSPEQALGEDVDPRTDLFSLGVVLYEALSTRHPFPAKNLFELFTLHQNGPPPLDEVPQELAGIVLKSLAYEKDSRYNSAEEFRNDLQLWLGESFSGRFVSPLHRSEGEVITRRPLTQESQARVQSQPQIGIASSTNVRGLVNESPAPHDSISTKTPPNSNSMAIMIGVMSTLIILVGAVGLILAFGGSGKKAPKEPLKRPTKLARANTKQPHMNTRQTTGARLPVQPPVRTTKTEPATPAPARPVRVIPPQPRPIRRMRRRTRRRTWRRRYRPRYRRRRQAMPPIRREITPPPRPAVVIRQIPTPPRPRVVIPPPRPRVIRTRRVAPPRPVLPSCPSHGSLITYTQLDQALGRGLTTRKSRVINKAAKSGVYDAGLRLAQSWRLAPVVCKKSYLCGKLKSYLRRLCSRYKPHSHCSGYTISTTRQRGRTYYRCANR